jgi:hypothetical protein
MPQLLHPQKKPVKVYRSAEEWLAAEHGIGPTSDPTQEQSVEVNSNARLAGRSLKTSEGKES